MTFKITGRYMPIRETGAKIERRLRVEGKLMDPRGEAMPVWLDKATASGGLVLKVPSSTNPELTRGHTVFHAFENIHGFEKNFIRMFGAEQLTGEKPVVLHRFGLFNSYGMTDISFFHTDGNVSCVGLPEPTPLSILNFGKLDSVDATLENAIRRTIRRLLIETPDAYLFLHVFGRAVDLGLADRFIDIAPGYELTSEPQVVPIGQGANIRLLLEIERNFGDSPILSYINRYKYPFETVDNAAYHLFVNGTHGGFNNRRGMQGMVRRALKQNPGAKIFVHRTGSKIDFNLADELMELDVREGYVERRHKRY